METNRDFDASQMPTIRMPGADGSRILGEPATGDFYAGFHAHYVAELSSTFEGIDLNAFAQAVEFVAATAGDHQVFTFGNGGTHTIADHMAHNFNWDASSGLEPGEKLSARCLSAEAAEVTARYNDRSGAYVFATQLENHARRGDVVVAFSGSGRSDNVVKALDMAREMGLATIFIGPSGSPASERATITIGLNSGDQQIVEDCMTPIMHMFIRALKVRLGGLSQDELLRDIASLRTRMAGIEALSSMLGLPAEIAAFIENGFRTALSKLAAQKVALAAQSVFPSERRDGIGMRPLGPEFTSFTHVVSAGMENFVGKVEFGATIAELMQLYARNGASGLVDVFFRPNTKGEQEYSRSTYIHKMLGNLVPESFAFRDGVAFYRFIDGITVQNALKGEIGNIPFRAIGETLRYWHRHMANSEIPAEIKSCCEGQHDTIDKFGIYFSPSSFQRTVALIIQNGHLNTVDTELIGSMFRSANTMRQSGILRLPRDTWSHGDFQPENIVIGTNRQVSFVDNDMHLQPGILDVAKMVSRTIICAMENNLSSEQIAVGLEAFLEGYYQGESIPYQQIAEAVVMDLLDTIGKYADLNPKDLHGYPPVIRYVLTHVRETIIYVDELLQIDHTDISSILPASDEKRVN